MCGHTCLNKFIVDRKQSEARLIVAVRDLNDTVRRNKAAENGVVVEAAVAAERKEKAKKRERRGEKNGKREETD